MMFAVLQEFKVFAFSALVLKSFQMGFCGERASRLYQDHRNKTSSLPFHLCCLWKCHVHKQRQEWFI